MINMDKNMEHYKNSLNHLKNKNIHIGLYTKKANENHLFIFKDNNAFMRYFIPNIQKLKTTSTGKKITLYEINDAGLLYLIQFWERKSDLSLPNFSLPMPSLYRNSEAAMYRWDNEKINECLMKNIPITNDKLRKMIGRELIDKPIFAIHVVNKQMLIHDGISRRLSFTCPLDKNGCISKKIIMSKLKPSLFLTNYYEIISNAFHIDDEKDKLKKEKDALLKRLEEIKQQELSDKDSNICNDESEEDESDFNLDSQDLDEEDESDCTDSLNYENDDLDHEITDVKEDKTKLNVVEESKIQTNENQELKEDLSKSLNIILNTTNIRSNEVDIIPDTEDVINIATPDTIPIYENNSLPEMDDTQEYISHSDEEQEKTKNTEKKEQEKLNKEITEIDTHTPSSTKKKRKKNIQSILKKKKHRQQ